MLNNLWRCAFINNDIQFIKILTLHSGRIMRKFKENYA